MHGPPASVTAPTSARHWLDGTELGRDGVLGLAHRALALRSGASPRRVRGRLATVFFNPSLRTRTSVQLAAQAVGLHCVELVPGQGVWGFETAPGAVMDGGAAEHLQDAVRVLAEMCDVLAVRSFAGLVDPVEDRADGVLQTFVDHASRPVISLESARWHPLQGLADTTTWAAHLGPELRGRRLTLTWAPHPKALPTAVPNQVLLSAALQGMHVTVAHPEGFDLDPQVVARASDLAVSQGGTVQHSADPDSAVEGAHVVVAKSWSGWSGYGRREDEAEKRAQLGDWCMTADRMARTDGAGFMHCLPIRRNVVATDAVLDGPHSWVHETGGLRMWTTMALLERLMEGW
ncbi:MAG: N-acetylornithine carbamoyltransferase [Myxococcota bacterium]|jgi:N-acetylornithine carbamoyltransferase